MEEEAEEHGGREVKEGKHLRVSLLFQQSTFCACLTLITETNSGDQSLDKTGA